MMKQAFATGILFITATAATITGCGPEVPANPTWVDDIRPLMVARCIRCHGNPKRIDPLTGKDPIIGFDDPTVSDPPAANIALLRLYGPGLLRGPTPTLRRMPPAPAEALEDWQIEMFITWAKNPPR